MAQNIISLNFTDPDLTIIDEALKHSASWSRSLPRSSACRPTSGGAS
jgi:hypothetical protein